MMDKRQANNWYPLQVWISFLILFPIVEVFNTLLYSQSFSSFLSLRDILNWAEFGGIVGLPLFLLFFLSFRLLIITQKTSPLIKLILNLICISGIFITCYIFFKYIYFSDCLEFSIIFIVSSLPFKIYRNNLKLNPRDNSNNVQL